MMNNILFITSFFPSGLEKQFLENSRIPSLDYASHNLQRAIISGLEVNGADYFVINIPHLGSFPPYYKNPFVPGYLSLDNRIDSISYINVSYFKRYDTRRRVKSRVKHWIKKVNGKKTIIFYSYDYLSLCQDIKKIDPSINIVLLAADLPEFMSTDNSMITRINNYISKFIKNKPFSSFVDGYILLAPAMKERLPVGNKPWIQIEGIYNPERDNVNPVKCSKKVVLYTGHLALRYGIEDLLKAFHIIPDDDYELWICGVGEGVQSVKYFESIDKRIKYLGTFTREKIISLQKQATLLINPRHSSDEYTKYSFPSKTMEYLASGTPTLMSHLSSIPKEYDSHIFYFDDESIEGMSDKIQEICNMGADILCDFGKRARQFIFEEKIPDTQVKKLMRFLDSIDSK